MLYQTVNPHGGDIYGESIALDFSANVNPYGTPQNVLDAMGQALTQAYQYADPYCRALTEAIAEHEGLPVEYILCGNGASELIYSFCQAEKPAKAAELAPTFLEYSRGLRAVDSRIARYPLQAQNGFALTAGFLPFLRKERPNAVFLCNPNNPTGRTIGSELLFEILNLCKKQGIRLFLDECFLNLTENGTGMKAVLANHPQLIILKAFTKAYGMAGVRLGYCLCADDRLLRKMSETVQPWNVSLLAQRAGVAALKEKAFLEQTRRTIRTERIWLSAALKAMGFAVIPGEANYLLFRGEPGLDDLLLEKKIAIRNCENYVGLGSGWYRAAVRLRAENEILISAIGEVCGKEKLWQRIS